MYQIGCAGEWCEDKKEGKGKYIFNTGEIYEGHFANNNFDGEGTYVYANGDNVHAIFEYGRISQILDYQAGPLLSN